MEQRFDLEMSADRPILRLDYLFPGCTALIDTGALFPVWTKSRELLEALGAKVCKRNVLFSGFGGNVYGDIYTFTLQLGSLIYPEMHKCPVKTMIYRDILSLVQRCSKTLFVR